MWISPTLYGKFWLWWNYEISEHEAMDKLSSLYSDCCVSAAILGEFFFFFFPVCYKFICSYYSLGDLLNTHIQKASEFQSHCIWRGTKKVPDRIQSSRIAHQTQCYFLGLICIWVLMFQTSFMNPFPSWVLITWLNKTSFKVEICPDSVGW